jgi:hypothetical protein
MCLVLCGNVHSPAWLTPHVSSALLTASTSGWGDAAVPQIGTGCDRTEEPHAAPTRREVEPGEVAGLVVGRECDRVLGAETAVHVIEIGPEIVEVGGAEERPERMPHDALRCWQVRFGEGAQSGHCALRFTRPAAGKARRGGP